MINAPGKTILFVCTGNSCRSQMAEGFARVMLPEGWTVMSAGTIAAGIHPLTVEAMREAGIDISDQYSKTLEDIPEERVDHVVTLCGDARERCPIFPNAREREHWPIEDPIRTAHAPEGRDVFRRVRDEIRSRVKELSTRLRG